VQDIGHYFLSHFPAPRVRVESSREAYNFSREWGQSSGLLSILQVQRLGRSGRTKVMGSFIKLIFLPRRQGMGAMGGTWLELQLLLASAAPRAFAGVLLVLLLVTVAAAIATFTSLNL